MFKVNTFKKGDNMYIVAAYLIYLAISVTVTIWVARTLQKNGRVFLLDAFQDKPDLADSVNSLLVVGFYLINVGFVATALRTNRVLADSRQAIELVCDKIGMVLLVLGVMHFFNLYVFNRMRKRGQESGHRANRPPLPPLPNNPAWAPTAPIGRVLD
jgi:cytochrome c biogenesis protein CcdA